MKNTNFYNIVPGEHLEGFGSVETTDKNNESQIRETKSESDEIESQMNEDPIEFNAKQQKRLGGAIQDSFLHPKVIKTDRVVLQKEEPIAKTITKNVPPKSINHKFNVI